MQGESRLYVQQAGPWRHLLNEMGRFKGKYVSSHTLQLLSTETKLTLMIYITGVLLLYDM